MSKGLKIVGVAAAIGTGIYAISKLSAKASAADKLEINFSKLKIVKAGILKGFDLNIVLSASNGSTEELSFQDLFIRVYAKNSTAKSLLSESRKDDTIAKLVKVEPKSSKEIIVPITISAAQALRIPGLLKYVVQKYINPEAAVQGYSILVEYSFKSMGINISDVMEVKL